MKNLIKSFTGNFTYSRYLIFIVIEEKFFILKLNLVLKKENKKNYSQKLTMIFIIILELKLSSLLTALFTFMILFFLNNELSITFAIFAFFLILSLTLDHF